MTIRKCRPNIVNSYRGDNSEIPFRLHLNELIDNSCDANAKEIIINAKASPRDPITVTISDDGSGCDDLALFAKVSGSGSADRLVSGHYGVGGTMALMAIGQAVSIESRFIRNGELREHRIDVNWQQLENSDWEIDIPDHTKSDCLSPGTTIKITGVYYKQFHDVIANLPYDFAPAIRKGVRIYYNNDLVKKIDLPVLVDGFIQGQHEWRGKKYKIRCGRMVPSTPIEQKNRNSGFNLSRYHRSLDNSRIRNMGIDDYDWENLSCHVELIEDNPSDLAWKLTTHKMKLSDGLIQEFIMEELVPKAVKFIRPLQEAEKSSNLVISMRLESMLNNSWQLGQREKRDIPDEPTSGTVVAVGTKRKRKAKKTHIVRQKKGSSQPLIKLKFMETQRDIDIKKTDEGNIIILGTQSDRHKRFQENSKTFGIAKGKSHEFIITQYVETIAYNVAIYAQDKSPDTLWGDDHLVKIVEEIKSQRRKKGLLECKIHDVATDLCSLIKRE